MALDVDGTLTKVLKEVTGEGRNGTWIKQEFVVETHDQYPKKICFSLWGDKASLIKQYSVGEKIKVSFNAESREYNDKWFTELRAWRIESLSGVKNQISDAAPPVEYDLDDIPPPGQDDLPF